MLLDHAKHRLAVLLEAGEGPRHRGDPGARRVSVPVHERGQCCSDRAARVAVVGNSPGHEQCAEIGVAQAERPVVMAVPLDRCRRIRSVIDDDFLRKDHRLDAVLVGVGVECLVRAEELHQIQR